MKNKLKMAFGFFLDFLKIGAFTFGGGWSIVAQMQEKYVDGEGLLTGEEMLDITGVGRSLPGTMVANVAFLFGYRCGGLLCAIACVLGIIIPPIAVLSVVTVFYTAIRDSEPIIAAMSGVRAAVVPIIMCAVMTMRKGAFGKKICYVICALAFLLNCFFGVSCVLLIIAGAVAGIVFCKGDDEA